MRQIGKGVGKKKGKKRERVRKVRVKHWKAEGSQGKGLRLGPREDKPDYGESPISRIEQQPTYILIGGPIINLLIGYSVLTHIFCFVSTLNTCFHSTF